MLTRPNASSGVPVYIQLMEQVKHGLATGAFRPGEMLPGIRPLAEVLVINPNMVERAYRALAGEGVIDLHLEAGALVALTRPFTEHAGSGGDRRLRDSPHGASWLHELEAARAVQRRLLPQAYPPMARLEYAGLCRPARRVGGDYYDFIRLSDTVLATAIGDVSGKGIPAALLMAALRAYVHGQTLHGAATPADIVRTLNRLVCDSVSADRYASFFYAHYDASTLALEYVNAGHNPPLIFRAHGSGGEVLRLEQGGPVLGILPDCRYSEGRVTLQPDDVVVAFTDGICEAMSAAGDEWGEERLSQLVSANRGLSPGELIDRILRGADEFAAGAAQHHDMTLVTMRVT